MMTLSCHKQKRKDNYRARVPKFWVKQHQSFSFTQVGRGPSVH